MKKWFGVILLIGLMLSCSMQVQAAKPQMSPQILVKSGYAADNTYYEIYHAMPNALRSVVPDSYYAVLERSYRGNVVPPASFYYSVPVSGTLYAGTVYRTSIRYDGVNTIAKYSGMLYSTR